MNDLFGSKPSRRRWGYRAIQLSLFGAAFSAALIVLSLFAFQLWQNYNSTIEAEKRNSRNLVRSIESHIQGILSENEVLMADVGALYTRLAAGGFFDEAQFHDYLKSSAAQLPQVRVLFLLDERARPIAASHVNAIPQNMRDKKVGFFPDRVPTDRRYFLGSLLDAPAFARVDELWSFPVFHKIQDANGTLQGYVAGIIDPTVLNGFLSTLEVGEYGDVLIWDQSGRLIAAHPNSRLEAGVYSDSVAMRMSMQLAGTDSPELTTIQGDLDGAQIVVSHKSIEGGQIGLVAFLNGLDYLGPWHTSFYIFTITGIFVLSIISVFAIVLGRELRHKARDELALEIAKREAEQANLAKTHFLAQVSHEFRTPLNAIIGFSDMMKTQILAGQSNDKALEYTDDILTSGHHLLSVVNDVIDLARIDSGELNHEPEKTNVHDSINAVVKLLAGEVVQRKVRIQTEETQPNCHLNIDKRLLKQVLINLISNAVKFSPPGSDIRVAVTRSDGAVIISIHDQGSGVEPNIIDRIGEPFLVSTAQLSAVGQGAGLGLSIAKRIMDLVGGELIIESGQGQGTVAQMKFPEAMVVR